MTEERKYLRYQRIVNTLASADTALANIERILNEDELLERLGEYADPRDQMARMQRYINAHKSRKTDLLKRYVAGGE
jgi:hypothetical protein